MTGAQPARITTPAISWSPEAVRKLRSLAIEGLLALPQRGIEVGGLLLGTVSERAPYLVSVQDIRPVKCEHRFGPGFILSESDYVELNETLASARAFDEHFVIGYYRSHTGPKGECAIDDTDAGIISSYFSDHSHIFLALKPWSHRRCEAAVYFWAGSQLARTGPNFELGEAETVPMASVSSVIQAAEPSLPPAPEPMLEPEPVRPDPPAEPGSVRENAARPAQAPAIPPAPQPRPVDRGLIWALAFVIAMAGLLIANVTRGLSTQEKLSTTAASEPAPPQRAVEPEPQPESLPPPAEESRAVTPPPEPVTERAVSLGIVQMTLPDGIRNRITSPMRVSVQVRVSETGRVLWARPAEYVDGLQRYLAQQAAAAARSVRFRPARSASGLPLPSTETLVLTYEPR